MEHGVASTRRSLSRSFAKWLLKTIQSFGFVDIPGDIKAPKKGSVPIKISVSESEDAPRTTFTFKYTAEQIKRPTCRKFSEIEL